MLRGTRVASLVALAVVTSASAARSVTLEAVLLAGDTAPNGTRIIDIGGVAYGPGGVLASRDTLDGPAAQAILAHGADTTMRAASGDPAPGGGTIQALGRLVTGGSGTVVFRADVDAGNGTVSAIFVSRAATALTRLVTAGDATPAADGSTFTMVDGPAANVAERIAFHAVDSNDREGLFETGSGPLAPIALSGEPSPAGGLFVDFGTPSVAEDGAVAFFASSTTGKAIVVRPAAGGLEAVVRLGDAVPGGGTFSALAAPAAASATVVAFRGTAARDDGPRRGVFRVRAGRIQALALEGDAVPGTDGRYVSFGDPAIAPDGTVAFRAVLTAPAEAIVTVADTAAVVVAAGAEGPAGRFCPAGVDPCFGNPALGLGGRIAFRAALDDALVPRGLFLADSAAGGAEPAIVVDCDRGGTITDGVSRVADDGVITVRGQCRENVRIASGRRFRLESAAGRRRAVLRPTDPSRPALEIAGGHVTIDGLRIRGASGIAVEGTAQVLRGVRIVGGGGVRLTGGGHVVTGCRVRGASAVGVEVAGDGIQLDGNVVRGSRDDGVLVIGDAAALTKNTVSRSRGNGIVVEGNASTIDTNRLTHNAATGLVLSGTGSVFRANRVTANHAGGILATACNIDAGDNHVTHNTGGPAIEVAPCDPSGRTERECEASILAWASCRGRQKLARQTVTGGHG